MRVGSRSHGAVSAVDLQPNYEEIYSAIRYALDRLRSENRHHDFEVVAFQWGRARVARNLRLAGGPVAAGGDQGRDGETYFSYYEASDVAKPIVFICTTRYEGEGGSGKAFERKAKSDINKVMSREPRPGIVYALFTSDVAPAPRHRIVDWADTTHGARVEVIDGQALARDLASPDLLWIARDHLRVPRAYLSSMLPDLHTAAIAARLALPVPPGVTTEITHLADGSTRVRLGTEPGTEPLQFGPLRLLGGAGAKVERAFRFGEAVRLIRNDAIQEFELEVDARVAGLVIFANQELEVTGTVGEPRPFSLRIEGVPDFTIPYVQVQSKGTHRLTFSSPHLPAELTVDFLDGPHASLTTSLHFDKVPASRMLNLLRISQNAQNGRAVFLRSLLDEDVESAVTPMFAALASDLDKKGFLAASFLQLCEAIAVVEGHTGVNIPLNHPFSASDIMWINTLSAFYSTGTARIRGSVSTGVVVTQDHQFDSETQLHLGGPEMKIEIAGVDIPLSDILFFLENGAVYVGRKRVQRVSAGQHLRIGTRTGFILQRRPDQLPGL